MKETILSILNVFVDFSVTKALPAIILIVVGILAVKVIVKVLQAALAKTKLEGQLSKLVLGILKPVLYLLLGLIVAARLGIDVTSIVALASVLTLAVSLTLQNALANIFGGFTLLYTKPFSAEDYVEIAGQAGTVKEVGLAYTKLATPDNKLISIPNSAVVAAEIVNYTTTGKRRLDIAVTASYDADPRLVLDTLLAMADQPEVLKDPEPFAGITNYGDHSIEYVLRVWVPTDDYWTVNFRLMNAMKAVFDAKGIEMTYPHLNVHVVEK